jgi:hypothetical protein
MAERVDQLLVAAEIISEVSDELDVTAENCKCCNLKRFTNFNEFKQHEQLTAMATKLKEMARRIKEQDKE